MVAFSHLIHEVYPSLIPHASQQVSEVSWNLHNPWLFASVSDVENTLHVWHPSSALIQEEDKDDVSDASSYDSDELEGMLKLMAGSDKTGMAA